MVPLVFWNNALCLSPTLPGTQSSQLQFLKRENLRSNAIEIGHTIFTVGLALVLNPARKLEELQATGPRAKTVGSNEAEALMGICKGGIDVPRMPSCLVDANKLNGFYRS